MKPVIKIGRDNSNDIVINEPRVSRNHAIITDLGNGTYEIKDLGSTNGTFVNGKRITQQVIREGDKVEVAGSLVNWLPAFKTAAAPKQESIIQEEPFAKIVKTITVGSSSHNDIVINDSYVSNYHAKISLLKNGNYYIQDLGSRNSTYVNGAKVQSKNFTKTDIVKIAACDLPPNWFLHKKLKPNFFKDNKKVLLITLPVIPIAVLVVLFVIFMCPWFNIGCSYSAEKLMNKYKNSLVQIEHRYFYTITFNNKTYYVGKNKDFKVTEANTVKDNLLPYGTVKGSGCFINDNGLILTSAVLTNPWLFNEPEKSQMLKEVFESKTISDFSIKDNYSVCGETAELRYLVNGSVNNPQNYTSATTTRECLLSNNICVVIQSVKNSLPEGSGAVDFYFNTNSVDYMHHTEGYYYSTFSPVNENETLQERFIYVKDTANINARSSAPVHPAATGAGEGSAVINERGELVGVVQQNYVIYLPRFYNQIKK